MLRRLNEEVIRQLNTKRPDAPRRGSGQRKVKLGATVIKSQGKEQKEEEYGDRGRSPEIFSKVLFCLKHPWMPKLKPCCQLSGSTTGVGEVHPGDNVWQQPSVLLMLRKSHHWPQKTFQQGMRQIYGCIFWQVPEVPGLTSSFKNVDLTYILAWAGQPVSENTEWQHGL